VKTKHTLDGLSLIVVRPGEVICHVNPTDHEDLAVLFDLTHRGPDECPFACVDATRLQRASKGAGQSTTGGGDHIVDGGRV